MSKLGPPIKGHKLLTQHTLLTQIVTSETSQKITGMEGYILFMRITRNASDNNSYIEIWGMNLFH